MSTPRYDSLFQEWAQLSGHICCMLARQFIYAGDWDIVATRPGTSSFIALILRVFVYTVMITFQRIYLKIILDWSTVLYSYCIVLFVNIQLTDISHTFFIGTCRMQYFIWSMSSALYWMEFIKTKGIVLRRISEI